MFHFFSGRMAASASVLALTLASGGTAFAATGPQAAISISGGNLDSALMQLSRRTGVQIVADPKLISGKKSLPVEGNYNLDQALKHLLQGKHLTFDHEGGMVVIKPLERVSMLTARPAAAPAYDDNQPLESVVVTGFRGSIEKSLNEKREASNVIEVISAEDIGKFPTNNIAEALQRVPGVSITRDRGEGLFVRVRGLGGKFQNVTIDGHSAAVNENVRDSTQYGRQFRFDTLASELISSVEVIKTPLASMDEGAIGGTINIKTFKPLDFDAPTLAMSYMESYVELARKLDPKATVLASWNNPAHNFGVLISVNYTQRSLRSDRITEVSWSDDDDDQVDVDDDGVADSTYTLSAMRPTLEREERARWGASFAMQWKPDANTEITFSNLYTRLRDNYDELTYSADFNYDGLDTSTATIKDGMLVSGTTEVSTQIGHEIDQLIHSNNMMSLKAMHSWGDFTLTADVYWGNAYSTTGKPITRTRVMGTSESKYIGDVAFSIPMSETKLPTLDFLDTDLDSDELAFRRMEWRTVHSLDVENAGQLDGEYDVRWGPVSKITAGIKYRKRFRNYRRRDLKFYYDTDGNYIGGNGGGETFDSSYFNEFPVSDFLSEAGGNMPTEWLVPNFSKFWSILDTSAIQDDDLTASDKANSYYVSEKMTSGYVAADIDTFIAGMNLRGEAGVRFAGTRQLSSGFAKDDDTDDGGYDVSYTRHYFDVMPSLNLALDLTDTVQLHASLAKVITRPSLADVSPRLTLNSSGTIYTAEGGNPHLKPFEAMQYDLSAEWYFQPGSALIGGVFYKDITTFVYDQDSKITVNDQEYTLTAPVNGGNAYVLGFELAYQQNFTFLPAPFDGLGAMANYTYTSTGATYSDTLKDDMQDVAKNSYNLTMFYEKRGLEARLAWSWIDDVLNSVGDGGLSELNEKAYGQLDGDFSYQLTDYLTAVIQAQNITDAAQWKFAANGAFGGYTFNGRTITFGLRAKF